MRTYKPKTKRSTKPKSRAVKATKKWGKPATTSYSQNYASSVESYQTTVDLAPNQAYALAPTLSQFARSRSISENYQFYRCSQLEFKFEPLFNTYQDISGGSSVPQLFWLMNRSGTQPNVINTDWLQAQGAKPHKLTSNYVIKYAPSTLAISSASNVAPVGSANLAYVPKWKQWLNTYTEATLGGAETLNDAISQMGHLMIINQEHDNNPDAVARMTVTAKWEFNKPYLVPPQAGDPGVTEPIAL